MVATIITQGKKFLFRKEESILTAGFIIGATLLGSAFLGLARDRLLATYFGAEPLFTQLGLYVAADRIPNFVFNVLVVGTITTAFMPVFTKLHKRDEQESWDLSSSTLNFLLLTFAVLSILIFIFADKLTTFLSFGTLRAEDLTLMRNLMRIMIFAQFLLVVSSFITGVLQSFQRFLVPALAPVLYNVGIIIFILLFSNKMGVFAPAWGMVFGAFLHLFIQCIFLKGVNFTHRFILNFRDPNFLQVLVLTPPRSLSLIANQISLFVDTVLAVLLGPSYLVVFNFAQHLQNVPVNFFGASLSQAALPSLSKSSDNLTEFMIILKSSFRQIVFFTLPLSVLFIILRIPLVRLVFGASRFSWNATISTSYTLAFFSVSIVFQALVYLLNKAFYALCDTKTPSVTSFLCIGINIILAVVFIISMNLGIWSLAFAFSISSFVNFLLLCIILAKRHKEFVDVEFLDTLAKIGWASIFMGFALYLPMRVLDKLVFDTTRTLNLILLTCVVLISGFVTYNLFSILFEIKEREVVMAVVKKSLEKFKSKKQIHIL